MNNRFTKIVVTLATVTGISFSAGQVSADSINAAPQANGQAQGKQRLKRDWIRLRRKRTLSNLSWRQSKDLSKALL
ncbi:hypothetical protein AAT16_00065 [Salinicoccus halodurans]|uniref:Uncharacterized protein n=1 Tax=Salinicoccus halodurans TaxID=407035 RepID=A0ABM5T5R1_9STAP|nr:hypothetical protein [Salinicoccus halodurans]AKG72755.1 hypothetical protein AAT16_00065 [Salinicoccus halodurans]